jgi:Ca2+-binding RTX toxin-like protein
MAKFTFSKALSNHGLLPVFYEQSSMQMTSSSATSIVYEDAQGDRIVFTGRNLDDPPRAADDPLVTKVEFYNQSDAKLLTVSGLRIDPTDLAFTNVFDDLGLLQAGKDTFIGSNKADFMLYSQNPGSDKLLGKGGNDTLLASAGNNVYDGGRGSMDTLSFQNTFPVAKLFAEAEGGARVNLAKGKIDNPWGGTDKVRGIESVQGTLEDDVFIGGKARKEYFVGYDGDDRFTGGRGKDIYNYTNGHGNDTFTDFGKGDHLIIAGYSSEIADFHALKAMMEKDGDNVRIEFSETDSFTFLDTKISRLKESMFDILQF